MKGHTYTQRFIIFLYVKVLKVYGGIEIKYAWIFQAVASECFYGTLKKMLAKAFCLTNTDDDSMLLMKKLILIS